MPWTDEQKQDVIDRYEAAEPTPETSMEVVKEISEEVGQSPNGVRMILTKAGVYVKKAAPTKTASGGTRVSKQGAQDDLCASLEASNIDVDLDIISKLTGKAAVYFTSVVKGLSGAE